MYKFYYSLNLFVNSLYRPCTVAGRKVLVEIAFDAVGTAGISVRFRARSAGPIESMVCKYCIIALAFQGAVDEVLVFSDGCHLLLSGQMPATSVKLLGPDEGGVGIDIDSLVK